MGQRTLKFQQIADTRNTENISKKINRLKKDVINELKSLENVSFECSKIRHIDWRTQQNCSNEQKRITFYVQKEGRKTTWDDVYKSINKVKAVPYDFVRRTAFKFRS